MTKHETYLDDDHDPDDLRRLVADGRLPRDAIVDAEQLHMTPGQSLTAKAKELGCTMLTLRMWHVEWRGSGYDPDYVIRRGHPNYKIKNKWAEKDWPALVRDEIAKGRARHIGDVLLSVGLTGANAQQWSMRHSEFEAALFKSGIPHPKNHWRDFVAWCRHTTIDDYRKRRDL